MVRNIFPSTPVVRPASPELPEAARRAFPNFKGSSSRRWNGNLDGPKRVNGLPDMRFKLNYVPGHYDESTRTFILDY